MSEKEPCPTCGRPAIVVARSGRLSAVKCSWCGRGSALPPLFGREVPDNAR